VAHIGHIRGRLKFHADSFLINWADRFGSGCVGDVLRAAPFTAIAQIHFTSDGVIE